MTLVSRFLLLSFAFGLPTLLAGSARGQTDELRVQGLLPGGIRTTLTDNWGVLQFTVLNPSPTDRHARVVVSFPGQPSIQYGRDVWVPARSSLAGWLPIGPVPKGVTGNSCEIQTLLRDRTDGQDRLVLPPGEERVRNRPVRYQPRRPTTALLVDFPEPAEPTAVLRPDERGAQAALFVHTLRAAALLPEHLITLPDAPLPVAPEAFEGIDHFVLAGNRLRADPAGAHALRQWLQQGGRLWVMLDIVDPDVIAPLLGNDTPFQIVDRVGLTTVRLHRPADSPPANGREFEQPVDHVRVLPGADDRVITSANGWPAAFVRTVGRGRIIFTTLGARGWHRPRDPGDLRTKGGGRDSRSPYESMPMLPVALPQLEELVVEVQPREQPHAFTSDHLGPVLVEDIGYSIMNRTTAAAILGVFLLAILGIGVGLRRSRRPELVGWLAPAAAAIIAGLFLGLTAGSRRAVPETVATVAIIDVVPGSGEAAVNGLFAVYQPESGAVPLGTRRGGLLHLDIEGLEGQTRRWIQTDTDAWHWEDLALPAGVRTGRFKYTARTGPVSAHARFGPNGVEGALTTAAFRNPADALILTAAREPFAVRLQPDGTFAAGTDEMMPAGHFLAGAVLTDRQQKRQAVYRQLLNGSPPEHMAGRDLLLTWGDLEDVPFSARDQSRIVGTALWVIPLEFERPAAGTRVTVPPGFMSYRRVDGGTGRATLESTRAANMLLRFQLPASVRGLEVERATLHLRIRAPSRRVAVGGLADGRPVALDSKESPAEPIRVQVDDAKLLRVDEQGGLHFSLSIANLGGETLDTPWRIESLGLEIVGQLAGRD